MAKKKSLMDALSEYQENNPFGRAQKKEEREKKMARNASKTKSNTKTAFSTKQFLKTDSVKTPSRRNGAGERTPLSGGAGGTRPPRSSSGGGTSNPKSGSGSSSGSNSTPRRYRQQATVTRDNRNRGTEAGGIRNTGGRGTTPQAKPDQGPKPKRSDFPKTRMGTLEYQGAVRKWENKGKSSSSGPSAGRSPGRRGQGGRK